MQIDQTSSNLQENGNLPFDKFLFELLSFVNSTVNDIPVKTFHYRENGVIKEAVRDLEDIKPQDEMNNFLHAIENNQEITHDQFPIHKGMQKVDPLAIDQAIKDLQYLKNVLRLKKGSEENTFLIYKYLDPNIPDDKKIIYDESVRVIYIEKINEKIAQLLLKKCGFEIFMARVLMREKTDMYTELKARIEFYSRKYKQISEMLYGQPDKTLFDFTINNLIAKANDLSDNSEDNTIEQRVSKEFIDKFGQIRTADPKDLNNLLPNPAAVQNFNEQVIENSHIKEFMDLQSDLTEDMPPEEIAILFQKYINFLNDGKENNWKVLIEKDRVATGVDPEKKTIAISTRSKMKKNVLELMLHEVYTHINKSIKGEQSKLLLLSTGLAGYTDEGTATARQDIFKQEVNDFSGTENYLAVSLAYGLDTEPNKPRDFKEVFEVLVTFYKFYLLKDNPKKIVYDDATLLKEARKKAYERALRVFYGGPLNIPGVVNTSFLDYKTDSITFWKVLQRAHDKGIKLDAKLNFGKFGFTGQSLIYLAKLDIITDEDLNNLLII